MASLSSWDGPTRPLNILRNKSDAVASNTTLRYYPVSGSVENRAYRRLQCRVRPDPKTQTASGKLARAECLPPGAGFFCAGLWIRHAACFPESRRRVGCASERTRTESSTGSGRRGSNKGTRAKGMCVRSSPRSILGGLRRIGGSRRSEKECRRQHCPLDRDLEWIGRIKSRYSGGNPPSTAELERFPGV